MTPPYRIASDAEVRIVLDGIRQRARDRVARHDVGPELTVEEWDAVDLGIAAGLEAMLQTTHAMHIQWIPEEEK